MSSITYGLLALPFTALLAIAPGLTNAASPPADYHAAVWDPIHFKPAIDHATDQQCLACHQEILDRKVRKASPAGVTTNEALAWYQTLDTYQGKQDTFHRRHLVTAYAKKLMNLHCNTCHQGNDPREETANSSATGSSALTQRKMVSPQVCLKCHGQFPNTVMSLPAKWPQVRDGFGNNCLICHAAIRTHRHQVNFLNAAAIEKAGAANGDVCYGCHGGRAWYRIAYPYPRHAWPGMAATVPPWAQGRPTQSEPRFRLTDQ